MINIMTGLVSASAFFRRRALEPISGISLKNTVIVRSTCSVTMLTHITDIERVDYRTNAMVTILAARSSRNHQCVIGVGCAAAPTPQTVAIEVKNMGAS
jgi:hypothetical protein